MGLDQYAYKILNYTPASSVDFEKEFFEKEYVDLFYWRKHYKLQDWMYELYIQKGGLGEFNCNTLLLTIDDIKNLELWTLEGNNESNDYEKKNVLEFCRLATNAIIEGYSIVYDSWW